MGGQWVSLEGKTLLALCSGAAWGLNSSAGGRHLANRSEPLSLSVKLTILSHTVVVRIKLNPRYKPLCVLPDILGIIKENFQAFPLTPVRCPHCLQSLILVLLSQLCISVQPQGVSSKTDSVHVCRKHFKKILQGTIRETRS